MKRGSISIVGAGPGDPELITVKALRRIQSADVILYDRLVNEELLGYAKSDVLRIYCGKAPGLHSMPQESTQQLMINYAAAGCHVVRLKGGDPFVFGRGGEEALEAAAAGIPYEVIPGITSAVGAAASAGIPLTHRGLAASFAIVTGSRCHDQDSPVRWDALAHSVDTLVIYMGVSKLGEICDQLLKHGKDPLTPIALIENGTTVRERTVTGTLGSIGKLAAAMRISNPAIIIIGEVVKVREELLSLEKTVRSQIG
ncbi:uroporphyrinogen-III C-methyltransferase [Paenibacillus sp. LMG 31459]|jgi:uroporphyrin-III C-methyltransferase|uniref:uroporphyrinogen-III C-methyltransferase n=1 Tax=Paenibacillus phytohabitans TaxID=2654978 RepID=A0ABX1YMH5_9BACL|nr:uroporphyrinogen-III C-methyltransferase [Paenibacillus phytohabitans]NOU82098.1 uroporphyrinogen-III C-methyltransferase [Paenibacillus phytohabitans]